MGLPYSCSNHMLNNHNISQCSDLLILHKPYTYSQTASPILIIFLFLILDRVFNFFSVHNSHTYIYMFDLFVFSLFCRLFVSYNYIYLDNRVEKIIICADPSTNFFSKTGIKCPICQNTPVNTTVKNKDFVAKK